MSTIADGQGGLGGGGGFPIPMGAISKMGLPGILLVVAFLVISNLGNGGRVGGDIGDPLDQLGRASEPAEGAPLDGADPDAKLVEFMSFVLDDVQNFWEKTFAESGKTYQRAELVLFEEGTQSACGGATSQIGPHYCPLDNKSYLDLDFFRELRRRYGAPGDFAQAYVLAHEISHHVQNLLGISDDVRNEQEANPDAANELSIRLELQADCLAGVWAYTTYERKLLEEGDLEEGLTAAAAVGDDRIQKQATGRVDRESWTHGSSAQRVKWFRVGFKTGDPNKCDTFAIDEL